MMRISQNPITAVLRTRLYHSSSRFFNVKPSTTNSSDKAQAGIETLVDELCIPLEPTWSVKSLLSSYSAPRLDDATFNKLHSLSALTPPSNPADREKLRSEVEEMLKMIHAVRLVPEDMISSLKGGIVDARIWPEGQGIELDEGQDSEVLDAVEPQGRTLLRHSQATDGKDMYTLPRIPNTKTA